MKLVYWLISAVISSDVDHKFYDHDDFVATDYNMFDTFEGYTWHKYEHSIHTNQENHRQFYLKKQAQKEFGELLNITFDIDLISINSIVKPVYKEESLYPDQPTSKNTS
tara:strand:+ start:68 stop:394 length:327 start_codon:yes stop_codon:yes gene_type:complete